MELLELKADSRNSTGKGAAKALRREGKTPAVLYGPDIDTIPFSVGTKNFEEILHKGSRRQTLFKLVFTDTNSDSGKTVMIKDLQRDPVSYKLLHIDFYEFDINKKIKIDVPVSVIGKAKGVEMGGILQIIRRELEVLCLPLKIPESIELDISDLEIGDAIHVKDITLQDDIEIPAEVNFTVVTILSPKQEEEKSEEEIEDEEGEEDTEESEDGAKE